MLCQSCGADIKTGGHRSWCPVIEPVAEKCTARDIAIRHHISLREARRIRTDLDRIETVKAARKAAASDTPAGPARDGGLGE